MAYNTIQGNAKKLRIYIGDSDHWRGAPLYSVLLETLKKEGLAGGTVIRGVAGFGAHSRIHTAAILDLSTDLPLVIEVIDSEEKIRHVLELISPMIREGLITLEDVEVISYLHRFLRPLPADRLIREIMTRNPVSVRADQPIYEAWELMLQGNIKALPVVDESNRVVGVVTYEDLMERAGLNTRLAVAQKLEQENLRAELVILQNSTLQASDVMSKPPITIHPDESIGLAADRLVKHSITRLPVVDEAGQLKGMVSRLDILRQVMDAPGLAQKHQPSVSSEGRLANEVMTTNIPLVREETDLVGIVSSFVSSGEHRVIVVNQEGLPVGLISDSDVVGRIHPSHQRGILGALRGRGAAPDVSITAKELMSSGVETVSGDTAVVDVIQRMLQTNRKWMVVVSSEGKPIGLINREIALEALIR